MDRTNILRFAADIRINTIRAIQSIGSGHIGGAMSICEVLAVLYGGVMNVNPNNPQQDDRDFFVLSKGHCGPALYATLALKEYFPVEELATLNRPGTRLPSHADRLKTPGIDMSTGSLGQGISAATGIAMGNKLLGLENYTYVIIGDGELQEGQVWEAACFASHQKLDRLIVFVDFNKRQLDGYVVDICDSGDIGKKFDSFGFNVLKADGTDVMDINNAIEKAKTNNNKPTVIILDTEKGQGCNFAEEAEFNHHMTVSEEMANSAVAEIEKRFEATLKEVTTC